MELPRSSREISPRGELQRGSEGAGNGAPGGEEFSAHNLAPDVLIAERYALKRRLGAGGMGEAWLAEDRVLERKVVLKRLTGARAADPGSARHLLSEARRATAIESPHIAQVYDVCSHHGEWLLAMEYVAGRDLRTALMTPLTPAAFFSLAIQLAEAVEAAHGSGILHCDIKPENIMVTEQGFVKVLDFGLARMMANPASDFVTVTVTRAGGFAGTPGYMAPEVLREASPTERSDIFSLGVVLYEMAGGTAPFRGKSMADSVQMTLAAEPRTLDLKKRGLPEELGRVLRKALMKEPERRYATVRDLLVDLRACAAESDGVAESAGGVRWKRAAAALATAAVVLSLAAVAAEGFLVLHRYQQRAFRAAGVEKAAAPRTRLLAVLPFRVIEPGNAATSAYSEGLREAITSSLARVAPADSIDVLAASEVRAHGLTTPEEAHKELGADLVIEGSYQQFMKQVRILYSLIDASGKVLRSNMVTSQLTDPFTLEDSVVNGVLQMLGSPAEAPGEFGTRAPAAYDAYLRGVGYLRDFNIAENVRRAAENFEEATRADPQFAAAYAGLGETEWAEYQASANAVSITRARESCGKAIRLNPNVAEAQICEGSIDDGTGQVQKAQQEFESALRLDPQSDMALNGLARTYEELEEPQQAEKVYRQAMQARPFYWANYYALANFLVRRAEYGPAVQVLDQAVAKFPANGFLARRLGVVYFLQGQLDRAAAILQRAIAENPHAEAYMDLGQVYLHQRQWGAAIQALETAARMKPQSFSVQADLADAYTWSGMDTSQATARYRDALQLSGASLKVDAKNLDALMVAAYCSAALGKRTEAMQYLDAALAHAPEDAEVNYYAARVNARLGDAAQARSWAEKAIAHGYSRADVVSAPDLATVSGNLAKDAPMH